jgi:hypothetical protein
MLSSSIQITTAPPAVQLHSVPEYLNTRTGYADILWSSDAIGAVIARDSSVLG